MKQFKEKFMLEEMEIYKSKYWTWSLRPNQITLGSSILSLNRQCTEFSALSIEESKDLKNLIKIMEKTLKKNLSYDKINYLMLMMEDEQVHFHVFPRYSNEINEFGLKWIDESWPKAIQLNNLEVDETVLEAIQSKLSENIVGNKKYKVGYTTGVYDMFHVGHLNLLKQAKSMCEYLIVGVTTDELVSYKNQKVVITQRDRMEIVNNCVFVDEVVSQDSMDKMSAWENLKFDTMFVGSDWEGTDTWNEFEREFSKVGVDIVYFPYTKGISSTQLRKVVNK